MKSWLRYILIVNFGVRNKIPKIPNAHQVILKFFRKQNIKGYNKRSDGFPSDFCLYTLWREPWRSPPLPKGDLGGMSILSTRLRS